MATVLLLKTQIGFVLKFGVFGKSSNAVLCWPTRHTIASAGVGTAEVSGIDQIDRGFGLFEQSLRNLADGMNHVQITRVCIDPGAIEVLEMRNATGKGLKQVSP